MKKALPEKPGKLPQKLEKMIRKAVKLDRKAPADVSVFNRFTFVGNFHFDQHGEAPISQDFRLQTMLEHAYQPLIRRLVISAKDTAIEPQWIPIEFVGYLILENRAGSGMLTTPTVEEVEQLREMIFTVRYKDAKKGFTVRPGGLFMGSPEDASELVLRAVNEPVNVNMYLFSL